MTQKRLLLIDDDAPTAKIMSLMAATDGYDVTAVASRESALVALSENLPDVIVMDYLVGGLEPAEFIEKARGQGYAGPILLCTGMHGNFDLAVDGVLHKPFDPDDFSNKLASLLEAGSASD